VGPREVQRSGRSGGAESEGKVGQEHLGGTLRLMTYNIAGASSAFEPDLEGIAKVVSEIEPDLLALQEAVEWTDLDDRRFNSVEYLAAAGGFGPNHHYGETLNSSDHLNVHKAKFRKAIFGDLTRWSQGNGLLSRSGFLRLG